jgi:hypothetical protein
VIQRVVNKLDNTKTKDAVEALSRLEKADDTATIINKFGNDDEAVRFLNFIDEGEIKKITNISKPERLGDMIGFYRAYKRFKNGKIPGKKTIKVNPRDSITLPQGTIVKQAPNTVHASGVPFNHQGFPVFQTDFTVKIDDIFYKSCDDVQFMIGNDLLHEAVQADASLVQKLNLRQSDLVRISKGQDPLNFTWHHNQNSGVLELVNRKSHADVGHLGGRNLWGGGDGYR